MALNICVCTPKATGNIVADVVAKQLGSKCKQLVYGTSVAEFSAIKSQNAPLALVVESPIAHDVIRDLCDDMGSASRRVKFIYSITAGVDGYRLHEMDDQQLAGIPFYNANGCFSGVLAEHILFAVQYFNRQCWRLNASKAAKKWDRFNMKEMTTQKIGVVGYGDIGQACGKLASAVGMQVTGVRRSAPASGYTDAHGVRVVNNDGLDEVIRSSDYLVGVLPGTADTKHFFDADVFSRMKPEAVFVNIGRGATQNEHDLVAAIKKGTIRGAALDVFEKEPLPEESPLWSLPDDKLLLSAHCADWTDDDFRCTAVRFANIFEKFVDGKEITEYQIDVKKGY